MQIPTEDLLREQKDYYRARAGEYDEWFRREGRYWRGPEHKAQWDAEVSAVYAELDRFRPAGEVLELACGTGWWTERLAGYPGTCITVVDASPEVIEVNRGKLGEGRVRYVCDDIFARRPDRAYDVVFFGFWLSHVPPERFAGFWEQVRAALAPGGRFFFVDSLRTEASTAVNHRLPAPEDVVTVRKLNDGRSFHIVKVFYDPPELQARLGAMGWKAEVRGTDGYFLYGHGTPG